MTGELVKPDTRSRVAAPITSVGNLLGIGVAGTAGKTVAELGGVKPVSKAIKTLARGVQKVGELPEKAINKVTPKELDANVIKTLNKTADKLPDGRLRNAIKGEVDRYAKQKSEQITKNVKTFIAGEDEGLAKRINDLSRDDGVDYYKEVKAAIPDIKTDENGVNDFKKAIDGVTESIDKIDEKNKNQIAGITGILNESGLTAPTSKIKDILNRAVAGSKKDEFTKGKLTKDIDDAILRVVNNKIKGYEENGKLRKGDPNYIKNNNINVETDFNDNITEVRSLNFDLLNDLKRELRGRDGVEYKPVKDAVGRLLNQYIANSKDIPDDIKRAYIRNAKEESIKINTRDIIRNLEKISGTGSPNSENLRDAFRDSNLIGAAGNIAKGNPSGSIFGIARQIPFVSRLANKTLAGRGRTIKEGTFEEIRSQLRKEADDNINDALNRLEVPKSDPEYDGLFVKREYELTKKQKEHEEFVNALNSKVRYARILSTDGEVKTKANTGKTSKKVVNDEVLPEKENEARLLELGADPEAIKIIKDTGILNKKELNKVLNEIKSLGDLKSRMFSFKDKNKKSGLINLLGQIDEGKKGAVKNVQDTKTATSKTASKTLSKVSYVDDITKTFNTEYKKLLNSGTSFQNITRIARNDIKDIDQRNEFLDKLKEEIKYKEKRGIDKSLAEESFVINGEKVTNKFQGNNEIMETIRGEIKEPVKKLEKKEPIKKTLSKNK